MKNVGGRLNGLSEFSSLILNNKQRKNPHRLMSAPTSIYFVTCGFSGKKCVCVCVFQVHDCSSLKILRGNCHVEDQVRSLYSTFLEHKLCVCVCIEVVLRTQRVKL